MDGLFGNLLSQQNLPQLSLIGSLLSGKRGDDVGLKVSNFANAEIQQQNQERLNRANDLQQVSGLYKMALQQDAIKAAQDAAEGRDHVTDPNLGRLQQKMMELSGLPGMAGGLLSTAAPQTPAPSPQVPPAPSMPPVGQNFMGANPNYQPLPQSAPPTQAPTQPQAPTLTPSQIALQRLQRQADAYSMGGFKDLADAINKRIAPIATRNGVYYPDPLNPGRVILGGGMMQQGALNVGIGPDGQPQAGALTGQVEAAGAIARATAQGQSQGKLPFEKPDVVNTPGAPRLMTPAQQIEAATGQNPLQPAPQTQIPPAVQDQRDQLRLRILQDERARIVADPKSNPGDLAAIDKEIAPLQRPSQQLGMELQDQSQGAAQRELGQGIGKEAANVFTTGASSVQQKRLLAGMSDLAKSYQPGKFQPLKSQLAQYATALGMPEDAANAILKTNTGDIQALTSAAISMAGKLTRQSDAQPSQLQFLKTLESMPMADRSPQGFARILDYLNSAHDYNIDKMVALQNWLQGHQGDPSGFEADWAQKSRNLPFVWNKTGGVGLPPNQVRLSDGRIATFPSATAAAAFRKQAGIQ